MKTAVIAGATCGIDRAASIAMVDEAYWFLACGQDERRGTRPLNAYPSEGRATSSDAISRPIAARTLLTPSERMRERDGSGNAHSFACKSIGGSDKGGS
jgi:hypothetical protein